MPQLDLNGELVGVKGDKEELEVWRSYLYKSLRIGDVFHSFLAAREVLNLTQNHYYLFKILRDCLLEDGSPVSVSRHLPAISTLLNQVAREKGENLHPICHAIYIVAAAPKNYEIPPKDETEYLSGWEHFELSYKFWHNEFLKSEEKAKFKFPLWVFDYYTSLGSKLKEKMKLDLRLSGISWEIQKNG